MVHNKRNHASDAGAAKSCVNNSSSFPSNSGHSSGSLQLPVPRSFKSQKELKYADIFSSKRTKYKFEDDDFV